MYEVVVEGPEVEVVEKIKKARSKDEDVVRVVEKMKKVGVKELQGNEWMEDRRRLGIKGEKNICAKG